MRCDEVKRELSAPTGAVDPSRIAGHLARCAHCGAWAERVQQFDETWNVSRPIEPSSEAFYRVWATVLSNYAHRNHAATIQATSPTFSSAVPAVPIRHPFQHRSVLAIGSLFALAASVFVAFGLYWSNLPTHKGGMAGRMGGRPLPAVLRTFEAEPGETLVIRISGRDVTANRQPPSEISETETVSVEHDLFNFFESQGSL